MLLHTKFLFLHLEHEKERFEKFHFKNQSKNFNSMKSPSNSLNLGLLYNSLHLLYFF